jgi:hypothetical protein
MVRLILRVMERAGLIYFNYFIVYTLFKIYRSLLLNIKIRVSGVGGAHL